MYSQIAVIGLGYVGLPLAMSFIEKGFNVIGIDKDEIKLDTLRQGKSYISDIPSEQIFPTINQHKLTVTHDFSYLRIVDAMIICVPTPLTASSTPDLSYLQEAVRQITPYLKKDHIIILESTTYPGTTREVLKPLLEQSGLKAGVDIYIGYSPERIDPGNTQFPLESIPKVISGLTEQCANRINLLYGAVFQSIVRVSSTEVAEMTKLLENSYRFINISLINELAVECDMLKIDIWEVIDAASTKPFGYSPFYPSSGIGGHCIPVDPLYLQWRLNQTNSTNSFIHAATQMNHYMPEYVVKQLQRMVPHSLDSSKILVLGVTYKPNMDDTRESSALKIMKKLLLEGANLAYHDPFVKEIRVNEMSFHSIQLDEQVIREFDCVLITTNHKELPLQLILDNATHVYDTNHATKGMKGNAVIVRLGGGEE